MDGIILEREKWYLRYRAVLKRRPGGDSEEERKEGVLYWITIFLRWGMEAGIGFGEGRGREGTDEDEAREGRGGGREEEVEVSGLGGEDPVVLAAGWDQHGGDLRLRRLRFGRGERGVENRNAERIGVVVWRVRVRIWEGEADEAVRGELGEVHGRLTSPHASFFSFSGSKGN